MGRHGREQIEPGSRPATLMSSSTRMKKVILWVAATVVSSQTLYFSAEAAILVAAAACDGAHAVGLLALRASFSSVHHASFFTCLMHWLKMMMACPGHVPYCVCVSLRVCLGVVECRAGSCALQVVFECVVTFRLPLRSAVRP